MTRTEQERWAVKYLAANLSHEEIVDGERSITIQAFADFFAAQWPRTFNKMAFAAKIRAVEQLVLQDMASKKDPSVQMFDRLFTLPRR